jgi:cytochrome c oxidase subunit 1
LGHVIATVGSWVLIAGLLLFFGSLLYAVFRGKKASANPWHGVTLEWTVPSPPPVENFDEIPEITHEPYYFPSEVAP